MQNAEHHSAADTFVAPPQYDLEVVQMSQGFRRGLRAFGLLLCVILPALSLHFDPYGFDVVCDAGQKTCTIAELHFGKTTTTTVAFDEIKVVQAHTEWNSDDDGGREPTGRYRLTFEMKDGRSIDASLGALPEVLKHAEMRKYIQASAGLTTNPFTDDTTPTPQHKLSTRTAAGDYIGIFAFFFLGLFLFALTFWQTEVSLDSATQVLLIRRRRWPLLSRTMVRTSIDNVKSVRTQSGELSAVMVKMNDDSEVRVARMLSSFSADAVTEAIQRKLRKKK